MRLLLVVVAATACLCAGAAQAHPGPTGQGSTVLDRFVWADQPVYCGGRSKRVFALTFDDGPGPWTEWLLAALRRAHAPATFFLVGDRIALWQSAARAEASYGVVGDHTWTHPPLSALGPKRIEREVLWTQEALQRRLHQQTQLFRPPYERASPEVERIVESLGLLDVRWNVDSLDSRQGAEPGPVAREVVSHLKPGAIVLMHDTHPWTAKVVTQVLAAARRKHLWPVTIPRLLSVDPPTPHENCYG